MSIHELMSDWRSAYAEWVSAELQLRAARRQQDWGRIVPLLEENIRALKQQCSQYRDAVSTAPADPPRGPNDTRDARH